MREYKLWLIIASLLCFFCIAIGAFAAHGLKNSLDEYSLAIIDTGVKYQMFASLSLFVMLISAKLFNLKLFGALICQALGCILFSGSLYFLAISEWRFVAFITPVGGSLLLISWLIFMFRVVKKI